MNSIRSALFFRQISHDQGHTAPASACLMNPLISSSENQLRKGQRSPIGAAGRRSPQVAGNPQVRQQPVDVLGLVRRQPGQHILEVGSSAPRNISCQTFPSGQRCVYARHHLLGHQLHGTFRQLLVDLIDTGINKFAERTCRIVQCENLINHAVNRSTNVELLKDVVDSNLFVRLLAVLFEDFVPV